jgi:hypothetical protein
MRALARRTLARERPDPMALFRLSGEDEGGDDNRGRGRGRGGDRGEG